MSAHSEAQVHIRVSREFKRALKIFCAREGITEQGWGLEVLQRALIARAPDLSTFDQPGGLARKRRSKGGVR
jgi:hypothetical protein